MFSAIVAGTDGSETARDAVRAAVELARLSGARLHVVTAYGASTAVTAMAGAAGFAAEGLQAMSLPEQRSDAEALLSQALSGIDTDGVTVEASARQGEPADVLLGVAKAVGADLIVVGSRGMTGARRFFLGSVPNRVAHQADCSVHIVHTC